VRDANTLNELMRGVDVVFHLAAESAVLAAAGDPEYCFDTNVSGTFRVLHAARLNGVKRVVFTSSREVYGEPAKLPVSETDPLLPANAYGASKAAGEMCCRSFAGDGPEIAIVRLSNVYGPGDRDRVIPRFVRKAILGLPLTVFGGAQILDFVWIGTVAEALLRSAFGPHIAFPLNIGSGQGVSILELCQRIVYIAGSRSPIDIRAARSGEVVRFVADITAARQAFGLTVPADPLFGLAEIIAEAQTTVPQLHRFTESSAAAFHDCHHPCSPNDHLQSAGCG
jgi:UDP-glucose 4-epimerase